MVRASTTSASKRHRSPSPAVFVFGFVARLPAGRIPDQMWAWGRARFERFRVETANGTTVVGGLHFKGQQPRSLKHFQRLLNNNLTNWGYEGRPKYEHGWLRFVSRADFGRSLRCPRVRMRWPALRQRVLESPAQKEAARLRERRRVLNGGSLKPGQASMGDCALATEIFDGLCALTAERRATRNANRETKCSQFNLERFGTEVGAEVRLQDGYSEDELDFCQTWAEVALRRGPPRSKQQMRERAQIVKICREQIQSARLSFPVGG